MKVYFRTHPIQFLLHSGVPPIYCARMTEANLGLGGLGRRGIEQCARLWYFSFSISLSMCVCVYESM